MVLIIVILSVSTLLLGYTTYNLLRKNEALEDAIEEQEVVIADVAEKIDSSMAKMKDIDKLGSFEADDETGFIFKNLYEIISELEQYYGSEEKE
jgi:cell division protein FtsL